MQDEKLIAEYYFLIKGKILKGHYTPAVTSAEKFVTEFPQSELSHYLKGICHFMLEEYEVAISCYEKVLAINPEFARAHYNIGSAFFFVGQTDKALTHIAKALILFDKRNEEGSKQKCIESLEFIQKEIGANR